MSQAQKLLPERNKKYRLITRSDMDGLVCGVLLQELGIIDDVMFAHPRDMQEGLIEVSQNDITANLPYVEGVYMSFDHHDSEVTRVGGSRDNHIIMPDAPSAARVVYEYFGGAEGFPNIGLDMMEAVDKADAANFSKDDILHPEGWDLLSFIMDSRTGLGRFRDFNISNYQLMMMLIDQCQRLKDINKILELPDVKERTDLYMEHKNKFREQIERCSRLEGASVILDLRKEETIWAGNRFVIYALFPHCNLSIHVMWGRNKQNTVLAIGKSILNKTSRVHVGNLCLEYGGGGHQAAGTCQVENMTSEQKLREILDKIDAA